MAIVVMRKISIVGLLSDRRAIVEELHKMGSVEILNPDPGDFQFEETSRNVAQCDQGMAYAESALAVLRAYAPEKAAFMTGRQVLPTRDYTMAPDEDETISSEIQRIIGLADKIKDCKESIKQGAQQITELKPYLSLEFPMDTKETDFTFVKTGTLAGVWQAEGIRDKLAEFGLQSVHYEILGASKLFTYVWFVFPQSQEGEAGVFLRDIGLIDPTFELPAHEPAIKTEMLREAAVALEQDIQAFIAEIQACSAQRRGIELYYDHLSLRKDNEQALSRTGMTEYTFYMEGYTQEKRVAAIKARIEGEYAASVDVFEEEESGDAPVMFENNAFVAPVEGITEAYSMPSHTDIDPNPIMSFFYYLFFGIMFSDAGYGLLLATVCGYLGFSKRLDPDKRKNFVMFFYCGLSTVFWGLMFGGFFGDIIYTISFTFFGKAVALTPIWLDPVVQAVDLLIYSVAMGAFHVLLGMSLRFYILCRQHLLVDALCDVGVWILMLLGLCGLAGGMGLSAPALSTVGIGMCLVAAAGLLLTGGRKNKSIIGKIFGGVLSLYDIMGYISDALSYCRLMALGLATGAIANVINLLGAMFGGSFIGAILFIVIGLFGHTLNFAMNLLGAYVHTNRLQYVEFFRKFYEGGGRKFAPFRMNTKFYRFSDE